MRYFLLLAGLILSTQSMAQFDPEYNEPEEKDTTKTEEAKSTQEDPQEYKPSFLERTYVGGNVGLSLGPNFFFFDVSPLSGYDLIPQVWSVGLGITYRYQRWFGNNFDIYGGRIFTRVNIPKSFFLHFEYEYLNFIPATINSIGERFWDDNILVGGGIWFNKSERGGAYLSVLYVLTTDPGSLYQDNPLVISPGFVFYLK